MDNNPIEFSELIKALLDESTPFPPTLLYHLSSIHPEETKQLAETWPKIMLQRRQSLLEDLDELADKDYLLDFDNIGRIGIKDPDPTVCINAISLLWQAEDRKLIPDYLAFLKNSTNEGVRAASAGALGPYVYLGEVEKLSRQTLKEIEDGLLDATRSDTSMLVRRRALESLGYSSRPEVEKLLQTACQSQDPLWIESALVGIGRSADDQWEKKVVAYLRHEAPEVQVAAVHAAGELGFGMARAPLLRLLKSELDDEELRAEVIWALSQIGGEGVEDALEALLDECEDPDEIEILEQALDNLSFTDDSTGFNILDVDYDADDYDFDDDEDEDEDDEFDGFGFDDEDEDY